MNKREYAISLGLAKAGRGKLSRAAHEAINKAIAGGMTFSEGKTTRPSNHKGVKKTHNAEVVMTSLLTEPNSYEPVKAATVTGPVAEKIVVMTKVRHNTVAYAIDKPTKPGCKELVVAFTKCGKCEKGIAHCNCKSITPPSYVNATNATLTRPV